MTLQNRVTPRGDIIAVPDRGMFMGNRGCLHDEDKQICKDAAVDYWIICQLKFNGRKRELMSLGKYTELFFLDEATALAAGHRPCGECRRTDFNRFKKCWIEGNAHFGFDKKTKIAEIDQELKVDRRTESGDQRTFSVKVKYLPDGVMITGVENLEVNLIWQGKLRRWSPDGYEAPRDIDPNVTVDVLTPSTIVETIRSGYTPIVHPKVI